MSVLTLHYRHSQWLRPAYLKHSEVEGLAAMARQQLVDANMDAIPMAVLGDITRLKINDLTYDLYISTDHVIHDENNNPVLGICEYDPGVPDTAMISVSPIGDNASEELVLSTLGHELGHAILDAPGWIVNARMGPGLFDDPSEIARKAYRTTTRDGRHLAQAAPANDSAMELSQFAGKQIDREVYFAELRANEFMGSLLVPRQHLNLAIEELAPQHGVTIHRSPSLDPELPGITLHLTAEGEFGFLDMECLQKSLAKRFGVNPRFIQVRMERYGLLKPGDKIG
jgi:Zn-dependent peptidase ImmA (M78 family)